MARPEDSVLLLKQVDKVQLSIKDTYLTVEVADTEQEKISGLSNRASLAEYGGILFIYDSPTKPSFWMKDMKFPIDVIWIGEDKRVAEITANVAPETYPRSFQPSSPVQYVLEVSAGFADRHSIKVGDTVYW